MPDQSSTAIDPESLVLAATRATVTQVAPQELEVFEAVAADWRERGDRGDAAAPGGSVGFGLESGLITELIMQVASAAIGEVFSLAVSGAKSRWRRWRRRRQGGPDRVASAGAGQETRLREATLRHGAALGLSADQAALLADAIVGALRSSAGEGS